MMRATETVDERNGPMMRVTARGGRLAVDLAGIAATRADPAARAHAVLDILRQALAYDAGFIYLFDPDRGMHVPLVREGYGERIGRHMDTPQFVAEMDLVGLTRSRPPIRVRDLPMPPESLPAWGEYLYPAGFREGLGLGLFAHDGRYVGVLSFSGADPRPATAETCELIQGLSPLVAQAVDPIGTVATLASIVVAAYAAAVVTRAGRVTNLPALPRHPALRRDSPALVAALARLAPEEGSAVFLCPVAGGLARVTALAVPPRHPGHVRALVLLSPPPPLAGLTRRELEVLGALTEGWSTARIAAGLRVAERTVTAHIEHILAKLRARSRTVAAVLAVRRGLYIPVEVTTAPRGRAANSP
jgi:DNA-binding CsgD family transcriptional regulator